MIEYDFKIPGYYLCIYIAYLFRKLRESIYERKWFTYFMNLTYGITDVKKFKETSKHERNNRAQLI